MRAIQIAVTLCLAGWAGSCWAGDDLSQIAKRISKAGKSLQNKKVAVLPFPAHDGRESAGSTVVSERLITKIVALGKLEVIERSLLEKVLKELKLQSSGAIDEQSAQQIGKVLGVEAVVSGTLIDLGRNAVEVNARLIRAESGQILAAAGGEIEKTWREAAPVEPAPSRPLEVAAHPESPREHPSERPMPPESDFPEAEPVAPDPDAAEGPGLVSGPQDLLLVESGFPLEAVLGPRGRELTQAFQMVRRGEAFQAQKRFESLQRDLRDDSKAAAIARLGLSMSLFEQGMRDRAIKMAREVSEERRFPRLQATAEFVLGRYAEESGRLEEARGHYLEVVRRMPFQTRIVRMAGRRLRRMGSRSDLGARPAPAPFRR